jgi:LysR family nitrogen assimilation transcriptional regulator
VEARSLRYFQAVVEFGSYSRASEFLRISQPAVSRQVSRLEKELGKPLFVRSGHGVTPTEAGRLLFERSQSILRQLENAVDEIRNVKSEPSGTIALAVPPGAGHFLVPALVKRFGAAYPNVFLKVVAGFSGYIHEWLVRGRVDLACLHGPLPQRGFDVIPLVEEEVFLVGKPGAFPFDRPYIRTSDLASVPLILPSRPNSSRRLLDEWLSNSGTSVNVGMEVDDPSMIRALLKEGLGFSLLSQGAFLTEIRHDELQAVPFRPPVYWPLALMLSATKPRTDSLDALVAMILATVRELTATGAWPARPFDR